MKARNKIKTLISRIIFHKLYFLIVSKSIKKLFSFITTVIAVIFPLTDKGGFPITLLCSTLEH